MQLFGRLTSFFEKSLDHYKVSAPQYDRKSSDVYLKEFARKNQEWLSTAQPSLKAYERLFGFVAPTSPNLINLVAPDPIAMTKAAFWEDYGLRQWTRLACPQALEVAGKGLQNLLAGNTKEAEKFFFDALKLDPKITIVQFFLGETYRLQGNIREALKFLKQSRLARCGFRGPDVSSALIYWHLKDYARSERDFSYACLNNQSSPAPWFFRGIMAAEAGRLEDSLAHLAAARACGGADAEIVPRYTKIGRALRSGVSERVYCGIDPMKVPACICI